MLRAASAFAAIVAIAAATAGRVGAQGPGSTDPEAGSPAGTIYQIPLDTARRDAAPRPRGGGGGGAGSGSPGAPAESSPLRSENNFGSSSVVPGTATPPSTPAGHDGGSSPGAGRGGNATTGGGAGATKTGGGRSSSSSGSAATSEALIRPARVEAPSSTRAYLLLAMGIAVAIALAAVARVAARRR